MAKHNWPLLKAEFLSSDDITLTTFFHKKGFSHSKNYAALTKGWLDEKKEIQQKALVKTKERQTNYLVRRSRMGRVLQVKAFRQVTDKKLSRATLTELRGIIETGAKLEDSSFGEQTESSVQNLSGGVALGVEFKGPDGGILKLVARAYGDAKAGLLKRRPDSLGK